MQKIFKIIRAERIYIGFVIIIVLFNVLSSGDVKKIPSSPGQINLEKLENISNTEFLYKLIQQPILLIAFVIFSLVALVCFVLGLFFLARFIKLRLFDKKEAIPSIDKAPVCPFGIKDIIHVAILILLFTYLAVVVIAIVGSKFKTELFILQLSLLHIVALSVIIYLFRRVYETNFTALGLKFKNILLSLKWGTVSYVSFIPVFLIVTMLNAVAMDFIKYSPPVPPILEFISAIKNPWVGALFVIQVGLFAPFVEELFFRGLMYNALKKQINIPVAVVVSSVVFALLHGELMHIIPIACLGFLLAYVYEKTNSLFAAVFVHSIHNLATTFFALLLKSVVL